jgi:hypothetical protein
MPEVGIVATENTVTITIAVTDLALMPSNEKDNLINKVNEACRRAVLRVVDTIKDFRIHVELQNSLDNLSPLFGCSTPGLPDN